MRRIFISLFSFLSLVPLIAIAQRTAVVDLDSVISSMPETKIAMGKLDSALAYYQLKLNILSDSLDIVLKTWPRWTGTQKVAQNKKVKQIKDDIRNLQRKAENELEEYRLCLREPIAYKARQLCIKVGKQNNYSSLVEVSRRNKGILFTDGEPDDITWRVISEIGK
ncbi:MAG TPA: OmpH family outer membrane protein [Bacteroidia bacterium]|jgi:Skp family chaperone for outer membrane proteins